MSSFYPSLLFLTSLVTHLIMSYFPPGPRRLLFKCLGILLRASKFLVLECCFATSSKINPKNKNLLLVQRDLPHGTSSSHITLFVEEIVYVLNNFGLKNMYIVMDNAAIHKTPEVLKAIRDSGRYA